MAQTNSTRLGHLAHEEGMTAAVMLLGMACDGRFEITAQKAHNPRFEIDSTTKPCVCLILCSPLAHLQPRSECAEPHDAHLARSIALSLSLITPSSVLQKNLSPSLIYDEDF